MLTNKEFLVRTGITLPAGTTSQAPLTFKQGTNLTSLVNGAVEWDGFNLFISEYQTTNTNANLLGQNVARRTVAYTDSTMTATTGTYTAAGTTQGGATVITSDVAYIDTSSASSAPFNGVILPPAISGRRVTVVNNSANPIFVYPTPTASTLTGATSSGTIVTVSSTTGLYAGMPVSSSGGTGGQLQSGTVIVSVVSSTTFKVDKTPTADLNGASVYAGVATSINGLTNNAYYTMTTASAVIFTAVGNNLWMTESAAQISSSNGGISGTFQKGALLYAADIYGSIGGINDVTAGQVLLSAGANTAPAYGQIDLSNASNTFDPTKYLPASLGGTGSAGTSLNAAAGTTTYSILTSTVSSILIGSNSSITQIGGDLIVNGGFKVNGSIETISATNTSYLDTVLDLNKPGSGWLSSNSSKDSGLKYNNYENGSAAAATDVPVTGLSTNTGVVTLTLSESQLLIPQHNTSNNNSWITVSGASVSGYNGTYAVTSSTAGTVSYSNATTGSLSAGNVPIVKITTSIPAGSVTNVTFAQAWTTTGSISGTALTLTSGTGVAVGQYIRGTNIPYGTYIVSGSGTNWVINTSLSISSQTISSYVATVTYAFATNSVQPTLSVGSEVTFAGFTDPDSAFNTVNYPVGAHSTVLTSTAGQFTVSTPASAITTFNSGKVILGNRFAFSGWANDSQSFEFYKEGAETAPLSGIFSGIYGTIKGGGLVVKPTTSQVYSSASNINTISNGSAVRIPSASVFDSASSGSVSLSTSVRIGQPTLNAYAATTYATAATLYVDNSPTAGTNATITNAYALQVAAGNSSFGGDITTSGDLYVNGGDLISSAATFNLLNTSSTTTLNIGAYVATANIGASTTSGSIINIGNSANTTATNKIQFKSGTPSSPNSSVIAVLDADNVATKVNLFPTVGSTGSFNFGTGGLSFNIGTSTASGGNTTLTLAGQSSAGTVTIAATSGVTTANVFSTNVTTGNIFDVATTVKIGQSAASAVTLTLGPATANNVLTINGNGTGGTTAITTNVTSGAANIFTSVTGAITIGATTSTTNLGILATSGNGTIGGTLAVTGSTLNINGSTPTITTTQAAGSNANIFTTLTGTITIGGVGTVVAGGDLTVGATNRNNTLTINGNTATGSAVITSNVTSGTASIFAGVTGGVTIGGGIVKIGGTSTNNTLYVYGNGTGGTATVDTNVTTGAVNLFGTLTTGTITLGGAGSTVKIGSTSGNNTLTVNGNGTAGIATIDTNVTSGTASIFSGVTGGVTIGGGIVKIGATSANNTLYVYGNGTGGTATVDTNVTTGSVNLFATTTGTITIGGSSISSGNGVVKLGVSPNQGATGNEVVTAQWVLNSVSTINSISTDLGVATGTTVIDALAPVNSNEFTSTSSAISGTTLTIGGTVTGTIAVGQYIAGTNVTAGTYIVSNISGSGSGSTWTVSKSQNVTATTIYSVNPVTATVGSISGSGPWTATVTLTGTGNWSTSNISVGSTLSAVSGTISASGGTTSGSLYGGSPTSVVVSNVTSNSFSYTVTGGTTPVAGSIRNITAINPSNAGSFVMSLYRSGKYIVQANQTGTLLTRSQTSEILVTHDCPYSVFVVSSTSTGTTINTSNTQGLYVGMTVEIKTNANSDTINSSTTGTTKITAITTDTSITVTNSVSLSANTVLKAYVYNPSYSESITLTNNSATFTVPTTPAAGVLYPGIYVTGTGIPANTYITQIVGTTATMSNNFTGTTGAVTVSGTPNIYVTEYAVLETNGTITYFTADFNTVAPYNIQLKAAPLTTTTRASLGVLINTSVKMEKEMVEYF